MVLLKTRSKSMLNLMGNTSLALMATNAKTYGSSLVKKRTQYMSRVRGSTMRKSAL